MGVGQVALYVEQIQLVEQVKEVGTEFQLGALAEDFHVGESEGLAQRGVDIKISRPRKCVALDARRTGDRTWRGSAIHNRLERRSGCESRWEKVRGRAVGEVSSRPYERIVAVI